MLATISNQAEGDVEAATQAIDSADSQQLEKLHGVEIFSSGTFRGKTYSPSDLAEMVDNFNKFQSGDRPLLRSPAVIGHEETQEFLERTDLPAAAWAEKLWTEEKDCPSCSGTGESQFSEGGCESCKGSGKATVLKADFGDVPPQVSRLIKNKSYRTVSAEVYDEPPDGIVGGKGKMLRRTAFLGGEIPQVKTLAELPMPEKYAERASRLMLKTAFKRLKAGTWVCFSEVDRMSPDAPVDSGGGQMDRTMMLDTLAKEGYDRNVLDSMSNQQLTECLRVHGGADMPEPSQVSIMTPGQTDAAVQKPPAEVEKQDHADTGYEGGKNADDQAAAMAPKEGEEDSAMMASHFKAMAEHCAKMASHFGKKMAESGHKYGDGGDDNMGAEGQMMAEGDTAQAHPTLAQPPYAGAGAKAAPAAAKMSERAILAKQADLEAKLKRLDQITTRRLKEEKRATLRTFCERLLKDGKVTRAQIDGDPRNGIPGLLNDLLLTDDAKVFKFSEKFSGTHLDARMKQLEAGAIVVKFGERAKNSNDEAKELDTEAAKVRNHVEKFSERFAKRKVTADTMVNGFKEARKVHPEMTAEEFLGV